MSNLTEALNRIMNWLEMYQPEYAASFLPGLSRSEIDELVKPFNIVIPEEVYELYQWRNGRDIEPFNTCSTISLSICDFIPLHDAVDENNFIQWINRPEIEGGFLTSKYKNKILFPFLGHFDPDLCTVAISNQQEECYPVLVLFVGDDPIPFCPSITSMMFIIAEAYETGAYYLDEQDSKCLDLDQDKLLKIVEKYGGYMY
ncbi:MAG: hypothetical protein SAL07_23295 [Oscillatoria sp. PMC 1051.18]|nr:hypothetical protein [Oscillatoria sp. PMC 1050.18]MEC5032839.1 hypothetical protein [Oscillatoria sp. PMC 1051.18]